MVSNIFHSKSRAHSIGHSNNITTLNIKKISMQSVFEYII